MPDVTTNDLDSEETHEWLEALSSTIARAGRGRAAYLIEKIIQHAHEEHVILPPFTNTPYVNTITKEQEPLYPGDLAIERRLRTFVRWNALAMVVKANRAYPELGGHIASFASSTILYDVGIHHFFRPATKKQGADLIFFQGHSSPGIYAYSYLFGEIVEEQLDRFRREVDGNGLSSYPHPWLMPDYWQFPTVSMGLGPLMGSYQAHFMRYMENRGFVSPSDRKVWVFAGDGEMDEPESTAAISLAAREKLDNLIFVINCNLQRLDGPVRGNGKIIQELERLFRGAGWNVIKVIWGENWDPLLDNDSDGLLRKCMEETVDGEYQSYKAHDGAYVRERFFGKYPALKKMVATMSDEEIFNLRRGGHDSKKVYAAYDKATKHQGRPTVILTKTVKGYGMGKLGGEAQNTTHTQKKMEETALKAFRDRFTLPLSDKQLTSLSFCRPPKESGEMQYLRKRQKALGWHHGAKRTTVAPTLEIPPITLFSKLLQGTGTREISTTMALVSVLHDLIKNPDIGQRIVPIVPDEARTFGMDSLFRKIGIYSSVGQLYEPVDHDQVLFYKEDQKGQILEEGINEAGSYSSWIAASTAYRNHGVTMIPFYVFYSMFGFQRIGDLAWASGDMCSRGFLIGATSGRTTLSGEGLQHQDGHSHLYAMTIPNCISYDPTFAYELATIVHHGMVRMFQNNENVFYYITTMNENYVHAALPDGVTEGVIKGIYKLHKHQGKSKKRVQLMGSGAILREVIAAATLLEEEYGVIADVWSVTSFNELRREALSVERWNLLHPEIKPKQSYLEKTLAHIKGPFIAATDYMKSYADQIRAFIPGRYVVLGTDGFGRSDTRTQLRRFFEVDRHYIVIAALKALVDEQIIPVDVLKKAIVRYDIDPEKKEPVKI